MSTDYARLPLLNSYIERWAQETPDKPAMLQHEDGKEISYRQFLSLTDFFALRLLDMGIGPGDRVATMLVLLGLNKPTVMPPGPCPCTSI
jgi:acyl-CoA synthetase (AMP-forming)/AMP-acid ligase II